MAPSPLEKCVREDGRAQCKGKPLPGDEVVISGISGVFPSSENTQQFMENLYNKVDMVLPEDLGFDHPEAPKYLGKIDGVNKFDAQFFRVTYNQAKSVEPMGRKLLEHAYSAMFDAGVNPIECKGMKVGVFTGSSYSDYGNVSFYQIRNSVNGLILSGVSKTMFANRISFWLDGKGPSYNVDSGCTSSLLALEHAQNAMVTGLCDAAIVGASNTCFHPKLMLNLAKSGVLCNDGKTKCFDKSGDGYVRAEAVSVLFLQRAKDARRIYAEVCDVQVSYGLQTDTKFLAMRNSEHITKFLDKFYSNANVSPSDVEYVEANGAAIAEVDAQELEAIKQVFGKESDVKVGCVKSNMGNSEPASGLCAITKMCLAYHRGVLPANLHYSQPCVRADRVHVLSDHAPFERGMSAINQFSYNGTDAHVLLKGHYKPKDTERYKSAVPKLVLVSGRTEDCVNSLLDNLESVSIDPEQIGLLYNIFEIDIPGHNCRGYSILDADEQGRTVSLAKGIEFQTGTTRPLWLVYSGMGSQWPAMGARLLAIPVFAAAIERCHKVLQPKGLDLLRLLTDPDEALLKNILHSFCGIAAVQIGLTDILKALGIVPDNLIGHSMGEMGCGYFEGSLTSEEMILAAYYRGLVSIETPLIRGTMAAVGLGYKDIVPLCPPDIDVACHNSAESVTIAGPSDAVSRFITELKSQGVFAKEVASSSIAYHSRYIKDVEAPLLTYLNQVIKNPKPRTSKWISTSVPQAEWDTTPAKYCSAIYHTNNSVNPVLFEEASQLIPSNAVIVEVAPHGLMQAILKRSHPECTNIPLTRRLHPDPVKFLLEAIGKLYQEGFIPKVAALYPQIEFPVSTETPLLSHLVKWEHSEEWPHLVISDQKKLVCMKRDFVISLYDDEYKCLAGHVRNGVVVIPEAALLCFVWETLAMYRREDYRNLSVTFSEVHFLGEAIFSSDEPLRFTVMINKGNDKFEVTLEDRVLARGTITEVLKPVPFPALESAVDTDELLHRTDVYQLLQLRGLSYKDDFQSIHSSNLKGSEAKVEWKNNWITLLDSLIQLNILAREHNGVSAPMVIKHLYLNMVVHKHESESNVDKNGETYFRAHYDELCDFTRCAGVKMKHIIFNDKLVKELVPDVLETQSFIPHVIQDETKMDNVLQIQLQIVADNVPEDSIQVACVPATLDIFKRVSEHITSLTFHIDAIADCDFMHLPARADVLVVQNVLQNIKELSKIHRCIDKNTFILTLEQHKPESLRSDLMSVVSVATVAEQMAVLLKKAESGDDENVIFIPIVRDDTFSWVPRVQSELLRTRRVILISEKLPHCGLFGLVKKLRKEYKNKIGLVAIHDSQAPSFDPEKRFYKEQLQKNLTFNIFKKGEWGGYYRLPVTTTHLSGEVNEQRSVRLTRTNGLLDAVCWTPASYAPCAPSDLQVCFAGPSMTDAQKRIGLDESNNGFGMDFSGIDARGTRIMGLVPSGALASRVPVEHALLWPVPAYWSLRDAATVPLPYAQACYCLGLQIQLFPGQRLLVTEGAEPFGQACIALALQVGASVFVTVDDSRKKRLLLRLFPDLNERNIGYTHRGNFLTSTLYATESRCDIVVNCYSGDLRKIAMKCVNDFGVFLDLNEYDIRSNKDFDMAFLSGDRHYKAIQFANVFRAENSKERKELQQLVSEGVALGWVRPLPRVELQADEATHALRLVAAKRLSSRMLLCLPMEPPSDTTTDPRRDGVTLLLGAEGELVAALVERLVRNGARHLLMSKLAIAERDTFWKKLGVRIAASSENLQTEASCLRFLREGEKLGPVQEIYIAQESSRVHKHGFDREDFVNNFNKTTSIVTTMDLLSRNNCPELRKFVVIMDLSLNVADEYTASVTEKICEARNEAGLPALALRIERLNALTHQSLAQTALAASLSIRNSQLIATNLNKSKSIPYILKISEILGMNDIDEVDENLTLEDLNISEVSAEEVRKLIKDIYKIDFTEDSLRKTSIASLKRISNKRVNFNTKKTAGLSVFYSFVEQKEYLANEAMIYMRSLLSGTETGLDDVDAKDSYLMLIPGFDGHHRIFNSVCERMKVRAVALQLGPDLNHHTITQMAARLKRLIQKRFEMKSKFYLLGYSFGVNVALELAAMLEKEGLIGVVYCLDSSPDALRAYLNTYVGELTDSQLQCAILLHMYSLMAGRHDDQLHRQLDQLQHWSDRVELFINTLKRSASYTSQYARDVVNAAYSRLKLARTYEPDFKLDSEVVLVKSSNPPEAVGGLADDYNLFKYTRRPVRVFDVPADHVTVPSDCRVSNIINSRLDPHLIDLFRTMNLCQSYLTAD